MNRPLPRLPALDGLRAVAVYLVVLFHAGVEGFAGGFVGVDVFFVLSGFLITRLLLVEQATTGRIDLLAFYGRRIRRLLPAASVAIVATCLVFVAFSSGIERRAVVGDARAAALYVANWHFVDRGQDYFAPALDTSPFLHLWSLAVEEQFYVIWPVLMSLIARRAASSPAAIRVTAAVVGVVAAVGAAWALVVADGNLVRAYYGTDTRAYQLLVGAALAFALTTSTGRPRHLLAPVVAGPLLVGGLVGVIAVSVAGEVGPVTRGVVATVAAGVVVASIAAARETTRPAALLGCRPLGRLGDLSYGTYLWHWPLVIVLERTLVIGPRATAVVVGLGATALAKLSMDLVERPVRRRSAAATERDDRIAVGAAISTAVVVGLVVAPAILRSDLPQLEAVDRPGFTPVREIESGTPVDDAILDLSDGAEVPVRPAAPSTTSPTSPTSPTSTTVGPSASTPSSPSAPIGSSTSPAPTTVAPLRIEGLLGANPDVVGDRLDEQDGCVNDDFADGRSCIVVQGEGQRVLLVGDSHANKLVVAFAGYAIEHDLTLATVSMVACPWQRGVLYELVPPVEGARQVCRDQRSSLYDEFLGEYRPDVVVLVSHDLTSERYTVVPSGDVASTDGLAGLELIRSASAASLDALTGVGARVVVVEPLPNAPFDPLSCLDTVEFVEECAFDAVDHPPPDTFVYRELAADRPRVATVDVADLACPAYPRCDAVVDGVVVREDFDHLSLDYTQTIVDELMARIGL